MSSIIENLVIFADVFSYTFYNKRDSIDILSDFEIFLINACDKSTSTLKFIAAVEFRFGLIYLCSLTYSCIHYGSYGLIKICKYESSNKLDFT